MFSLLFLRYPVPPSVRLRRDLCSVRVLSTNTNFNLLNRITTAEIRNLLHISKDQ